MRDASSRREHRSFTDRAAKLMPGLFEMGEIHQGNATHRNKPKEILINRFHYKNNEKEDNPNMIDMQCGSIPTHPRGYDSVGQESNIGEKSFRTPDGWEDALLILEAANILFT
jgi:hypothetical protein